MAGAVLSAEEREEIRVGCAGGESFALMARALGRSTSTISEEVRKNGGRHRYERCLRGHGIRPSVGDPVHVGGVLPASQPKGNI
jgi:IS30 family transposase